MPDAAGCADTATAGLMKRQTEGFNLKVRHTAASASPVRPDRGSPRWRYPSRPALASPSWRIAYSRFVHGAGRLRDLEVKCHARQVAHQCMPRGTLRFGRTDFCLIARSARSAAAGLG